MEEQGDGAKRSGKDLNGADCPMGIPKRLPNKLPKREAEPSCQQETRHPPHPTPERKVKRGTPERGECNG